MTGATIAVLGERIIDMVPVGESGGYRALPGGSPANVALALARLGMDPLLLGRRANDGLAVILDGQLDASGLSLDGLVNAGGLSMLAVCTRNPDGSMAYSFYHRDSPDLSWTPEELSREMGHFAARGVVAWHTGSLVSWLGSGVDALLDAWRAARAAGNVTLSYDPNARSGAQDPDVMRDRVEDFIAAAHIVKASDEDVAYVHPQTPVDEVCARWAASGPSIVVLTRGVHGATVWRPGAEPLDVPGHNVAVADTVGAGDTVTAALLAGLADELGSGSVERLARLTGDQVRQIVARATAAAAITCSRPGADPPTAAEVDQFLQ